MARSHPTCVRSSDLVEWDFCAVKFYFERVLRRSPADPGRRDAARAAGTARHEAHNADVAAASGIGRLASALSLVGVAALLLMLLLGLAGCTAAAREETRGWFGAFGAGLIVIALLVRRAAADLRRRSGIPHHLRVLSSDAGHERGQLLRDEAMGLVGRPDYVFTRRSGLGKSIHTAEVKPRRAPRRPFRGHVLQTAASIHLARVHYGRRASRTGYLIYADSSVPVTLTPALADELRQAIADVRALMASPTAPPRNHASARRCAACPFAAECPASLSASPLP
jgi:CRISPR/Cas system-associated exonuclease Cas4 (RecB family)